MEERVLSAPKFRFTSGVRMVHLLHKAKFETDDSRCNITSLELATDKISVRNVQPCIPENKHRHILTPLRFVVQVCVENNKSSWALEAFTKDEIYLLAFSDQITKVNCLELLTKHGLGKTDLGVQSLGPASLYWPSSLASMPPHSTNIPYTCSEAKATINSSILNTIEDCTQALALSDLQLQQETAFSHSIGCAERVLSESVSDVLLAGIHLFLWPIVV